MRALWLGLLLGCGLHAQIPATAVDRRYAAQKRITPLDPAQRAGFEQRRKAGIAIVVGVGKYPRYSGLGDLNYTSRDADLLAEELNRQRYTVITLKDSEATRGAVLN